MKLTLRSAIALLVVTASTGCTGNMTGIDGGTPRGTVKLAFMTDQTGFLKDLYGETLGAAQLAVNQINAAGGVFNSDIKLVPFDEKAGIVPDGGVGDEGAKEACAAVVADADLQVLVGPEISTSTIACLPIVTPAKRTMIVPNSGAKVINTLPDDGYMFSNIGPFADSSIALSKDLYAEGTRKIAILFKDNGVGRGAAEQLKTSFEAAGGTVTVLQPYTYPTGFDANMLLSTAFAGAPELVYMYGDEPDTIALLSAWDKSANPMKWVLGGAGGTATVASAVGSAKISGMRTVIGAPFTGPEVEKYLLDYKALNGFAPPNNTDLIFDLLKYDSVMQAGLALAKAGKNDGSLVKAAMLPITNSPGTEIVPSQIADGLTKAAAGEDINYQGLSGAMQYNADGFTGVNWALYKYNSSGALDLVKTYVVGVDF